MTKMSIHYDKWTAHLRERPKPSLYQEEANTLQLMLGQKSHRRQPHTLSTPIALDSGGTEK